MVKVKTGDSVVLTKDSSTEYVVIDVHNGMKAFSIKVDGLLVWIDLDTFERAGGYVNRTIDDFPVGTFIKAKFCDETVKLLKVEECLPENSSVWRGYDRNDKCWACWYSLDDLTKIEVIK